MKADYQVLARKYRPQSFAQVVGQEPVVRALSNAIQGNRIAHAYLFVGPRGIGKTSTARIMAMALNAPGGPRIDFDPLDSVCREIADGRSLDVREIDGASNNGVEEIRNLKEDVRYLPQRGRFKIYIIDEVHMLTAGAFNALLKTLEEPPEHVKFIFATTEVHKVLPTILSRCQRFDLRRIPAALIAKQLAYIAKEEGIDAEPAALAALAGFADGGMRDAESAFDQLIAFCGKKITEQDVLMVFGLPPASAVGGLAECLLKGDAVGAWSVAAELDQQGKDLGRLLSDTVAHLRTLLIYQKAPALVIAELGEDQKNVFERQKNILQPSKLLRLVELLTDVEGKVRYALSPKALLEVALASACEVANEVELDDVIRLLGGVPRNASISPAKQPVIHAAPVPATASVPKNIDPQPAPKKEEQPATTVVPVLGKTQEAEAPRVTLEQAWEDAKTILPAMMRGGLKVSFDGESSISVRLSSSVYALIKGAGHSRAVSAKLNELLGRSISLEWVEEAVQAPTPPAVHTETKEQGVKEASDVREPVAKDEVKPWSISEAELRKDALIDEAMKKFGAKIVQYKKGKKT